MMPTTPSWPGRARAALLVLALAGGPPARAAAGDVPQVDPARGVPGGQARTALYLPHMTWAEVEQYLRTSDMVIIPVGSVEQHGKHLPLGSDTYQAVEICLRIGQKSGVLVAPVVLAGISEHHLGFPGTLALSPTTFEAVVFETAQSLVAHGFRRIMVYTGHGGNYASVTSVVQRINRETAAAAIDLGTVDFPPPDPRLTAVPRDSHAGVEETSMMLELAGGLVQMDRVEAPRISLPPAAQAILDRTSGRNQEALLDVTLWQPERTGKRASTREMTSNGVYTTGDVKTASVELGRLAVDYRVDPIVRFIEAWQAAAR